jgi:protein tyrosine phosphatase (PTP) superfamily phosphohydrolase (DUF442 family)
VLAKLAARSKPFAGGKGGLDAEEFGRVIRPLILALLTRRATLASMCAPALIAIAGTSSILKTSPARAQSAAPQVPFGDQGADLAVDYNRLTPAIATGGALKQGAIPKLKTAGFTSLVDLRGKDEDTAPEKEPTENAGLRYFNIPVTILPTDFQIAEFARIIDDPKNAPFFIHSTSANQVGAMWTMYRIWEGVSPQTAFEEGRTTGLQSDSEAGIRTWLAVRTPTK